MLSFIRLAFPKYVRRLSLRFEAKNRRVQCLGRTHGIEILAEERDLAAHGPQEQHILLAIDPPSGLDKPFRLDLGDRRLRIGEGVHLEVKKAEVLHRPKEPGDVTHNLLPPREARRLAQGWR